MVRYTIAVYAVYYFLKKSEINNYTKEAGIVNIPASFV